MTGQLLTAPTRPGDRFRTQISNERVVHQDAWNKLVVVAREEDDAAMINHALIQSRRRFRTARPGQI